MEINWTIVGPFTDLEEKESKWVLPLKKELINRNRSYSIFFLFSVFIFIIFIKLSTITNNEYLNPYNKFTNYKIKYLLPEIFDKNNKPIVENLKLFDVFVNPKYIHKEKLSFFLNTLKEYFPNNFIDVKNNKLKRQKVLENISSEHKQKIEELLFNFKDLNIFKSYSSQGKKYLYFPEFVLLENRKTRTTTSTGKYLQPYVGFYNENDAINGFEKWYSIFHTTKYLDILTPFNKKKEINNDDVKLSIDIELTKNISSQLLLQNEKFGSEKIISGIIDTKTGKVLTIATSNIWENGVEPDNTKNDFVNFLYEPGSVIKPLSYLSALENNVITPNDLIDIGNGKLKIDKYTIKDDHADKQILTAEEVIIHSSNVGISKIIEKLNGQDFLNTFSQLGMFNKPYIELPYISKNRFTKSKKQVIAKDILIHKANTSYGYGFMTTPLSLMSMYNTIVNDCIYVQPSLLLHTKIKPLNILSKENCKKVKNALVRTVNEGTGINTKVPGLIVGGKTGTAHIVGAKGYGNKFNSTFIGFVSDGKNTYTTFTVVHRPTWRYHYASQSAAVINKIMIKELINFNYLKPKIF